jgi:hypothetical protein
MQFRIYLFRQRIGPLRQPRLSIGQSSQHCMDACIGG